MTRLHDMGGRFGDGAVTTCAQDAPVFDSDWHAHAMAITLAAGALGQWTIDAMRHRREMLSPQDYMAFSYYEKWIAALADMLVARGVITDAELSGAGATAATPSDLSARKLTPAAVPAVLARGAPCDRPGPAARFAVGSKVITGPARHATLPGGHTRLPGYAAQATGTVIEQRGCFVFPDTNAHGLGENPQPLYTVAFAAADLWGQAEHPGDEVLLDLFEPYLRPA